MYSNGIAFNVPTYPRLMDAGWTRIGEDARIAMNFKVMAEAANFHRKQAPPRPPQPVVPIAATSASVPSAPTDELYTELK